MLERYFPTKQSHPERFLLLGLILASLSFTLDRFFLPSGLLDFFIGLLQGIAIPLMLTGLYYTGRKRSNLQTEHQNPPAL